MVLVKFWKPFMKYFIPLSLSLLPAFCTCTLTLTSCRPKPNNKTTNQIDFFSYYVHSHTSLLFSRAPKVCLEVVHGL